MHKQLNCHRRAQDSGTGSNSSVDRHEQNRRSREKDSPFILPVSVRFREALDYQKYRLADKAFRYDDEVVQIVANWAKPLQV